MDATTTSSLPKSPVEMSSSSSSSSLLLKNLSLESSTKLLSQSMDHFSSKNVRFGGLNTNTFLDETYDCTSSVMKQPSKSILMNNRNNDTKGTGSLNQLMAVTTSNTNTTTTSSTTFTMTARREIERGMPLRFTNPSSEDYNTSNSVSSLSGCHDSLSPLLLLQNRKRDLLFGEHHQTRTIASNGSSNENLMKGDSVITDYEYEVATPSIQHRRSSHCNTTDTNNQPDGQQQEQRSSITSTGSGRRRRRPSYNYYYNDDCCSSTNEESESSARENEEGDQQQRKRRRYQRRNSKTPSMLMAMLSPILDDLELNYHGDQCDCYSCCFNHSDSYPSTTASQQLHPPTSSLYNNSNRNSHNMVSSSSGNNSSSDEGGNGDRYNKSCFMTTTTNSTSTTATTPPLVLTSSTVQDDKAAGAAADEEEEDDLDMSLEAAEVLVFNLQSRRTRK